jgi:4-amino-4-deoxy-L-arabinose transferase-like glycosyltransferase
MGKTEKRAELAGVAMDLAGVADTLDYKLRIRKIFLLVSLLSIVWVYVFVYLWRRSWWEALTAAALLALSWEVGYHSRWIAPDAVLMQFAALSIPAIYLAVTSESRKWSWIVVSTVIAGLACGTKYTGGVVFLPVAILAYNASRGDRKSRSRIIWTVLLPLSLLFGLVFLLTTPGAVLQPFRFVYDVVGEMRHYRSGHGEHTITPGFVHAFRMGGYLSLSAFSQYWPVSLLVFLFAVVGAYDVIRRRRNVALVLLLVPAVYLLYLCLQRVMMARNLLMVMPFLAVLAARGIAFTATKIRQGAVRVALGATVGLLLAANGVWLVVAAESIVNRTTIDHGREIAEYLDDHSDVTFYLSRGALGALRSGGEDRRNVTLSRDEADRFMVMTSDLGKWYGNRFGVFEFVSGSFEVNLDYYVSWRGDPKVFVVKRSAAEKMWFAPPDSTVPP